MNALDWVGYAATGVFAASYFCKNPATLRKVQAVAASMWIIYGVFIHAMPVVVANLVVLTMALASQFPSRKTQA